VNRLPRMTLCPQQIAERRYPDLRSLGGVAIYVTPSFGKAQRPCSRSKYDGLSSGGVVWLLASNSIDPEISLGNNHTYRGVLSMRGRAYLALWDVAIAQMTSECVHSAEEEAEERAYIRKRSAEAG